MEYIRFRFFVNVLRTYIDMLEKRVFVATDEDMESCLYHMNEVYRIITKKGDNKNDRN